MKTKNQFFKLSVAIALIIGGYTSVLAQKKDGTASDNPFDDVVMIWNKNTPESEMNDDLKALKKYGITIDYSDVKRNAKNEITGLKVSYEDRKGNKGELKLSNQLPIQTIVFYKSGEQIGFGEPSYSSRAKDFSFSELPNGKALAPFHFHDEEGKPSDDFNPNFAENNSNPKAKMKSKVIIKKRNKKDLILEDGEVVAGGEDYTKEEIEKMKKDNQIDPTEWADIEFQKPFAEFDLRDDKLIQEFKQRFQKLMRSDEMNPDEKSELTKAKEEMIKAKEELQKARLALEELNPTKAKKN